MAPDAESTPFTPRLYPRPQYPPFFTQVLPRWLWVVARDAILGVRTSETGGSDRAHCSTSTLGTGGTVEPICTGFAGFAEMALGTDGADTRSARHLGRTQAL